MVKQLALILLFPAIAAASTDRPPQEDRPAPGSSEPGFRITVPKYTVPPTYAWDNFKHRASVMWACRQVDNGEFVANRFCRDKPMNDLQWPGMAVPANYRGLIID